ncbi:MAG TPA: hypothetical protein VE485_04400 [Mycobacterium sp.]|jgi:hypothetical protein|nr:hypothetical protein [Mycobacterium sp.]
MRIFALPTSAATVSVALTAFMSPVPAARADDDGTAINGTFTATSNGEWAQTNQVYHDEATVRSIWTIRTTCTTAMDCNGTVTSDQGWTAAIYTTNVQWYVKRDLPDWEHCPDGTAAPGHQVYRFAQVGADGYLDRNSTTYAGEDVTTGPSGACGVNDWLQIESPFKLVKIG